MRLVAFSAALALAAVASSALSTGAQPLVLPATGVGANVQPGVGYGLLTIGSEGPYIVTDAHLGRAPAPNAPTPGPRPSGALPALGPNDVALLVRDSQGVPALKVKASSQAKIPLITLRSAHRLTTFTDVTVVSASDAYGSATSQVPIADVVLHFGTINVQVIGSGPAPAPTATTVHF